MLLHFVGAMTAESTQLALVAVRTILRVLEGVTLEVFALAELAATDLADKIATLFVSFNVQFEVLLAIGSMLAARNCARKEFSGVKQFV